jgi:peptidoglycan/LPS O-acetylase OafA/YrhL
MKPDAADFRADINGLRAIAVLAVVLFHFGVAGFSGGFVGVDVFFVISGYLMTRIILAPLAEQRFSVLRFYLARARRIFPALAVLGALMLAYGWIQLSPVDYKTLSKHVGASLLFISNHTYWKESGYFDADAHEKWLLHPGRFPSSGSSTCSTC